MKLATLAMALLVPLAALAQDKPAAKAAAKEKEPPLAKVNRFAPGVAVEAEYKGVGLGATWSTPESRSVYMGEFTYN